ncbi:hypothetical protein [Microbacterium lacticum]
MGHRLVAVAFAFVGAFNERARAEGTRSLEPLEVALLALMAHSARDGDHAPAFFASRAETCSALGIANTEPGRKRVQRAVAALVAAGAITKAENVHRGSTPRHSLIYQGGALASTFSDAQKVDASAPPSNAEGGRLSTGRWTPAHGKVDASAPPYSNTRKDSRASARTRARGRHDCGAHGHELAADGTCIRCEYRDRDRTDQLATLGRTA